MKPARPAITILVHRDGKVGSRSFRIPVWVLRAGLVAGGIALALVILGAILYVPIVGIAAQVPGLRSEIAALREENAQIRHLGVTLDSLEAQYSKVRGMLGADVGSRLPAGTALPAAPQLLVAPARRTTSAVAVLARWPLDQAGYITRGQLGAGPTVAHAGVDIAIPVGTPVRVAGAGSVTEAGRDSEYGLFVLVQHEDGYQTRYAHLSRTLVAASQSLRAGEVIGLSGNTGRSSAPHLHFEISRRGQSVDPRQVFQEGR